MFGRNRHREDRRYYLLPSMGRSNKRHRRKVFIASVIVGVVLSAVMGTLVYFLNR